MKKERKVINLTIMLILITVISLSYGFASFSNNSYIDRIGATVVVDKSIKIISNTPITANKASTTYSQYQESKTYNGIVLSESDSYVILDIGILNLGNTDVGLYDIEGLDGDLKYEIINNQNTDSGYQKYSLKERLCDDKDSLQCNLGATTHILIKISYKDNDSFNNTDKRTYDLNLNYIFKRVYKIEYKQKASLLLTTAPVNYVMENENFSVGIDFLDVDYLSVVSSDKLDSNIDYKLENKVLSVNNVKSNLIIGVNYDTYRNMKIYSKWLSNNSVEITLDGTADIAFYIRLRDGDLYIATAASQLKNADYIKEPLFTAKDTIYQEFEYLSGTCNLVAAITIKFRDTTESCNAKDIAQFITHNSRNNNFEPYDTYKKSGPVLTGMSLSQLSFFTSAGNKFDNYKFKITYGKENNE